VGISPKLLSDGERVIVSTRTHWKALVIPALVLIVTCAVAGFLLAVIPDGDAHDILMWLIIVAAVVVIGWRSLWPLLNWFGASYTVTNRRLINRSGILTRTGRDIPLHRINDVRYEKGVLDRVLGCGTLVISDASEQGQSVLHDVPAVERLQIVITDLLFGTHDGRDDDGSPELPPRGTR
jgi:membrane protein YdbS with pleckstrin-like domain